MAQNDSKGWNAHQLRGFITMAPWISGFPGVALALLLIGLTLLGDGLRNALNPSSEGR